MSEKTFQLTLNFVLTVKIHFIIFFTTNCQVWNSKYKALWR